ncbi:MAG TPA: aspartate/glutamate racemase family protein [Candidatus Eremiobacteraceae bacterium]|nr:aspartate/glutamate racemase family protein [Candidatus Eremiobacteraceae bacterium]HXZ40149.1 aspartate/glutamate racemase family protein [Terriglobales bacterium]
MKTIGLIGGMSWESSAEYYRLINLLVRERLGGHANARSLMLTVNFAEIEALQREQNWASMAAKMQTAARNLEAGGADCIVLSTNTMHKVADETQAAVSVPLLHIADATAKSVKALGMSTVGLLGTRFTMEDSFYHRHVQVKHALAIKTPGSGEREFTHRAIYEELCQGLLRETTRARFRAIMQELAQEGAEGIILGCTELGLLLKQEDAPVPLFDSTRLHALAAVDFAMSNCKERGLSQ